MDFNIEEYINSLPLGVGIINVSRKNLTYLPDLTRFKKLKELLCSNNKLKSLPPLPNSLVVLSCRNNPLTELPQFNDNLKVLVCSKNNLTWLPHLNNNLEYLDCSENQLTELPPLNNKLEVLKCYDNKIFHKKHIFNKNIIQTLRNFRYTYYLLKFKKHFKRWLWEKVREPKVMVKFHPNHLNELKDTDDLEVFLENWIKH